MSWDAEVAVPVVLSFRLSCYLGFGAICVCIVVQPVSSGHFIRVAWGKLWLSFDQSVVHVRFGRFWS